MMGDVKIYHVETQEDYDGLMIKLENEGCMWASGEKPTTQDYWHIRGKETVVYLECWGDGEMTVGSLSEAKGIYPTTLIFKYKVNGAMDASKINIVNLNANNKAKGVEQMEKVVVPQFVADWYERTMTPNFRIGDTLKKLKDVTSEEIHLWEEAIGNDYEFWYETAEKTIVRMWLYDYEIKEEKKYYWRKKKECLCDFEEQDYMYLNVHKGTGTLAFGNAIEISISRTLFTETEVKQLVSEEDFSKLEKVEIEDV